MRYAVPVILLASPAFAHHEVVAVSVLPGLVIWMSAIGMAGLAAWRLRRKGRK